MIEVERKRLIEAPAAAIQAVLHDLEQLHRLLPRVERVEVQGRTESRARLSLAIRSSQLGLQWLSGEARILPDGLRFVAVSPAQIDATWTIRPADRGSEVVAVFAVEPHGVLGTIGRFVPRRLVEHRIAQEVERSLETLASLVRQEG